MTGDVENTKVVKLKEVEPPTPDEGVADILNTIKEINDKGEVRSILVLSFGRDNTIIKSFHFGEGETRASVVGSIELLKEFFIRNTDYLNEPLE
jgi:hypothetical protein